jgi:hypothetical protein
MVNMKHKEEVYHACREVYNAAQSGVPWHIMVHALREGLGIPGNYKLGPKDYEAWPVLEEVISRLSCTKE